MARSRNSSPRRAPAPARPAPARQAPPPAQRQAAPAPAPMQSGGGSMMGGLMGTVASGMAFGTGSAIAHRAVGAVANSFGGSDAPAQEAATPMEQAAAAAPPAQDMCANNQKSFFDCLNANRNDISACQFYLDQFNQCKQQSAYQ